MANLICILWLAAGVLLQVLVFNRLHLEGGIVLLYLYLLLKVPIEMNRSLQILLGFVTGLAIDVFCNTPGMHALAASTTMWLRVPALRMYVDAEDFPAGVPSLYGLGPMLFLRYALTLILLHTVVLYVTEAFSLFHPSVLLLKVFISVALTLLTAFAVELATGRRR